MKFTEKATSYRAIPSSTTISYNYKLSSNELRLERIGLEERIDGQPIGPVLPSMPHTNTYERVSGFTF
jgi:hypothetical protein